MPVGDSKVPSGALEYKSLYLDERSHITMDFCEWLFSHEPLVLKEFNFDASIVSFREHDRSLVPSEAATPTFLSDKEFNFDVSIVSSGEPCRLVPSEAAATPTFLSDKEFNFDGSIVSFGDHCILVPSEAAFPIHLLYDNALFHTQKLLLPMFNDFSNQAFLSLLHRQQLTHLSLKPTAPCGQNQQFVSPILNQGKSCNINAITEILLRQRDHLIEFMISGFMYVSFEPSADMERFLFSLRNFEIFSFHIAIIWKKEDISYIDRLYNSWLEHGCKKMKSFQMGHFEYQVSLTDELATKLDKMGLVISTSI